MQALSHTIKLGRRAKHFSTVGWCC